MQQRISEFVGSYVVNSTLPLRGYVPRRLSQFIKMFLFSILQCLLNQRFYKIHNVTRLRPDGVIGMDHSISDDASGVDQKPCRHRQFPGVVAIESFEVDAETTIYILEFF